MEISYNYDYKYYLASKLCNSNEWNICERSFILTVTKYIVGRFISNLWYQERCDGYVYNEFAIVRISENADINIVKAMLNECVRDNIAYTECPFIVLYGVIDSVIYLEARTKILKLFDSCNKDSSISVNCKLIMKTTGMINITLQGFYNNENELVTRFTLPVFQIIKDNPTRKHVYAER